MSEQNKKFINSFVWVSIIAFVIRCILSKDTSFVEFSAYDLWGYAGESISFATIIMTLYEKIFWKFNPLEKTPVLKRKYKGTFISTYDGIEREAILEIKQTLLSVSIIFTSGESKSKSITASVDKVLDEWQLTYCYLNVPQANVRERSVIHYGTAMLCVDNSEELIGQYFSDRKTTGDMKFYAENV